MQKFFYGDLAKQNDKKLIFLPVEVENFLGWKDEIKYSEIDLKKFVKENFFDKLNQEDVFENQLETKIVVFYDSSKLSEEEINKLQQSFVFGYKKVDNGRQFLRLFFDKWIIKRIYFMAFDSEIWDIKVLHWKYKFTSSNIKKVSNGNFENFIKILEKIQKLIDTQLEKFEIKGLYIDDSLKIKNNIIPLVEEEIKNLIKKLVDNIAQLLKDNIKKLEDTISLDVDERLKKEFIFKLLNRLILIYLIQEYFYGKNWWNFLDFENLNRYSLYNAFFKILKENINWYIFEPFDFGNWLKEETAFETIYTDEVLQILKDFIHNFQLTVTKEWIERYNMQADESLLNTNIIGYIYEKFINYLTWDQKDKGAYYTPDEIVNYINQNTFYFYLKDKLVEKGFLDAKDFQWILEADKLKNKLIEKIRNFKSEDKKFQILDFVVWLKIIDPACGSGHFLVNFYKEILDFYKEIGFYKVLKEWFLGKFDDWSGKKEYEKIVNKLEKYENLHYFFEYIWKWYKEKLARISNEIKDAGKQEVYKSILAKIFISNLIITSNIYWVDLDPIAVQMAIFRLYFEILKQYWDKDHKEILPFEFVVKFPNVDFNIMRWNSLIGFGPKEWKEFAGKIWNLKELHQNKLKEFFDKLIQNWWYAARNVINRLDTTDLIKIMKYYVELVKDYRVGKLEKDGLRYTTLMFLKEFLNEFFDDIFLNLYLKWKLKAKLSFDLSELKFLHPFHWIVHFGDVFEKWGFDIVVGNPPYIRQERIKEIKDYLQVIYKNVYISTADLAMYFIKRAYEIARDGWYHSYIITNKWLRAKYWKPFRKFLKENTILKKVIDFNGIRVFEGAQVDTMVYVLKKDLSKDIKRLEESKIFYCHPKVYKADTSQKIEIEKWWYFVQQWSLEDDVWNFVNEEVLEIKRWIEKVWKPLKELDVKILYGIKTGLNEAFIIDEEIRNKLINIDPRLKKIIKPVLKGKDIKRYYIEWNWSYIIVSSKHTIKDIEEYPVLKEYFSQFKDKLKKRVGIQEWYNFQWDLSKQSILDFNSCKVVRQEISPNSIYFYDIWFFWLLNTSYSLVDKKNRNKILLLLFNSYLIERHFWFISQFLSNGYRHTRQYIEKIPIKLPKNLKPYEILSDYLSFLNIKEDFRQQYKMQIKFFDKQIADSLVYELYFEEKFQQDWVYDDFDWKLVDLVSKYLKEIDFDSYARLYWKWQLEGLSEKEKEKLEDLEKKNLEVVLDVYERLKSDEKILQLIERIKEHRWVKVVEGKNE